MQAEQFNARLENIVEKDNNLYIQYKKDNKVATVVQNKNGDTVDRLFKEYSEGEKNIELTLNQNMEGTGFQVLKYKKC